MKTRTKGSQVVFDMDGTYSGRLGPVWLCIAWWFGRFTKLVRIQIWRFRFVVDYSNWKKRPGNEAFYRT